MSVSSFSLPRVPITPAVISYSATDVVPDGELIQTRTMVWTEAPGVVTGVSNPEKGQKAMGAGLASQCMRRYSVVRDRCETSTLCTGPVCATTGKLHKRCSDRVINRSSHNGLCWGEDTHTVNIGGDIKQRTLQPCSRNQASSNSPRLHTSERLRQVDALSLSTSQLPHTAYIHSLIRATGFTANGSRQVGKW